MAAEITRDLIITDDALKAPLEFAANFGVVEKSLDQTIEKLMQYETAVSKSKSTPKLKQETEGLTAAQTELGKIQKQIVAIQAKNNEEYIKEVNVLAKVKQALKEKTTLGDKDAKSVSAQNSSIVQLAAALNANRVAYDNMTDAEKRNSVEGKALLEVIKAQDTDLKKLKKEYGQSQLEVGNYENALKNLKEELKASKNELVGIAATLGIDSEEFKEASIRAGELNNEVGDLQATVKAVSGSKFENIGTSLGLVGSKLKALDFKGAASASNQLVASVKALTFKEATSGIGSFGKTMLNLGKALILNPIFLIGTVLIGIGAAVFALKDKIPFLTKAFDAMGAAIDFVLQSGKDLLDWMGLTTFALDEKARKTIDASKKEIEAIEERYAREIKIASSAGKETLDLEIQKNKDLIAEAAKGMQALLVLRKNQGGKFIEDQEKEWNEYIKIVGDANTEIQALTNAHNLEMARKAEERRLREQGDAAKLAQFLIKNEIEKQKGIQENEQKGFEDRINASAEVDELRRKLAKMERDSALKEKDLSASGIKLIEAEFQNELTKITQDGVKARSKITGDVVEEDKKQLDQRIAAQKAAIMKQAEEQHRAFEAEVQALKEAQIAKGVSSEEVDKQIAKRRKSLADEQVQVQIDALNKILKIQGLSAEESAAIDKELYKLKNDLTNAYYDNLGDKEKTALEKAKTFIDKYADAFNSFITSISDLSAAFTERRLQALDLEDEANEEQKDSMLEKEEESLARSLENETLTAEQKDALKKNSEARQKSIEEAAEKRQEDIEARRKKAVRKQAIFDKAVALVIGGIKLAQAVVTMLTAGPPAGFVLSALAAAIGAVQLATIAAKPIPAAEYGIIGHKGGDILTGEAGKELIEMPGKRFAFTKPYASVQNLPAGTNIYPADSEQTIRALALAGLGTERSDRQVHGNDDIKKELREINKTIKNKKEYHGPTTGYTQNGSRVKYIDGLRNRA